MRRPRTVQLRSLAAILFVGTTFGCYSERLPPPTFRYRCQLDRDCAGQERCISNLCQVPCTQATFSSDCADGNFAVCFNGVCSSVCDAANPVCTSPQECIPIPGFEPSSGGGGPFGGGQGSGALGICGVLCQPGGCPETQTCVLGVCTNTCDPQAPDACIEGLVCIEGACLPDPGDDDSATTAVTDTENPFDVTTSETGGETATDATGGMP